MSTVTQQLATLNPYLADLQAAVNRKSSELSWLVVSHNQAAITNKLSDVIDEESSAVLMAPQQAWDFDNGLLTQTVQWSLGEIPVRHLLLVGSSQAEVPGAPCKRSRDEKFDLLKGVNQVQDQIACTKAHYAAQVENLLDNDVIKEAIDNWRLQLHTLFYLSQSRSFLIYDASKQTFRPLS